MLISAALAAVVCTTFWLAAGQSSPTEEPQYTGDNRLVRPVDYRTWVWLSSGFGMSYRPPSEGARNQDPPFDNVFASPAAYRAFTATGKWPDKTMLVLEARASVSKASINRNGHFQGELIAVEVHVKDERRFPGKWAFFAFGDSSEPAKLIPFSADCYSCHARSGAVDTTFVQFYPTLLEIAKRKGTLQPAYDESR